MINVIEKVVCEEFNVHTEELRSGARSKDVVAAKNAVWYFLYTIAGLSSSKISREYHTTQRNFWYAISKLKFLTKADKAYELQFSALENKIKERF